MEIRRLGLIAGRGRFPFLVLEEAERRAIPVSVAAIREETDPAIEELARVGDCSLHWIGLGQLGRLIRTFRREGVDKILMAGQVRHRQIYARDPEGGKRRLIIPDVAMMKVLASLAAKNTSSLIQGIIATLEREGFEFLPSTLLLEELVPGKGVLTRRSPAKEEWKDIACGRRVAGELARLDLGQTVVVKDQAVVAVEAMEGTDETIRRASRIVEGRKLCVVKVSRPDQDMRFDVPVIGPETLEVFEECNVSALAIDAGRTLILERADFLQRADRLQLAVTAD